MNKKGDSLYSKYKDNPIIRWKDSINKDIEKIKKEIMRKEITEIELKVLKEWHDNYNNNYPEENLSFREYVIWCSETDPHFFRWLFDLDNDCEIDELDNDLKEEWFRFIG